MHPSMLPCFLEKGEITQQVSKYATSRGYVFDSAQAEQKLAYYPNGAWLVRYSEKQQAYYLSQMTECGRVLNYALEPHIKISKLFDRFPLDMHVNRHKWSNQAYSERSAKPARDLRTCTNIEKLFYTKNMPLFREIKKTILTIFTKLVIKNP